MCMKLEEIQYFLQEGKTIEEFVEKIDWKEFEKFVREIFSANNFKTISNFRFKNNRRFEIDLVAAKNNLVFVVDCKEWDKGRYKNSGLKKAAEDQIQRMKELRKFLTANPIAKNRLKADSNSKFVPIIVTWYDETVSEHENCFIVPVWKLNSFLISYSFY